MKKIYTLASIMAFTSLTYGQAQLPNASLDNWTVETYETTTYEDPTSWSSGNICASLLGNDECSVAATKSTDASAGTYAAKVVDDGVFGLNLLDYSFTDAPTSIEFKIKKNLLVGDTAEISFYLHKGSVFDDNIIGDGVAEVTGVNNSYATLKVNINYRGDKSQIDQLSLIISVTEDVETNMSYILVDDFKLNYGPVGLAEKTAVKTISVNPNPVLNVVNFNEELTQFDILSVSGQVVKTGANTESVDVSTLTQGIYVLKGTNSEGELVTSRFVKK